MPQLNRGIVKAWKLVYDAKLADEGYKKDYQLLRNIAFLRNNTQDGTTFWEFIGKDVGLTTILQKNKYAPCNTCSATDKHTYLNDMAQYIADIGYFTRQYRDKNGAIGVVRSMKGQSSLNGTPKTEAWEIEITVEGNAFMLRSIYQKNLSISEFEKKVTINNQDRYSDIVYNENNQTIMVDCKSWASNSIKDQIVKTSPKDNWGQFLDYLRRIDKMEKLEYWFDAKKLAGYDEIAVKIQVKNAINSTQNRFEQVFQAIWGNQNLKEKLFPITNYPNMNNIQYEAAAKLDFATMVSNTSDSFYKFIKLK